MTKQFGGKPSGRIGMRIGGLGLALLASTAICTADAIIRPAQAQQASASISYTIPAGPLGSAITRFGDRSDLQVLYPANLVRGKHSPGVSGTLTREDALNRLLAGTGLTWRFTAANTVTIADPAANAGGNVDADGSLVLDTVTVQDQGENAWGPVDGYVATRSATGTKTGAPLIETPQSISVVGRQEMEDRGVQTLSEAIRYTPGLTGSVDSQVNNGWDSITLRGFDYPGQFLDGLLNTNGWIEPYGVERIEVLRGPASILYGSASPGGVIGVVSKLPTEETIREVGVLTNQDGGIQGSFDFSGKVHDDGVLLYRLTGLGRDLGAGFNTDDIRLKRVYIAPSITWRPTDKTSLSILAKYQYDPGFPGLPSWPRVGTLLPRADGFWIPRNLYQSDPNLDNESYRRQAHIGYLFEHEFSSQWSVKQNLRLSRSEMDRLYMIGNTNDQNTLLSRGAQRQFERTDTFAVDNQILGKFDTGPFAHSTIFGLDFRRIKLRSQDGSYWDNVPPLDMANPVYGIFHGPLPELTSGNDQRLYQTGLYAQDQIKWGGLSLLLGGRYDWATSKTWDIYDNRRLTNETDQEKFTYRIGAVYEFENGIAPYVSYSTSFEPQTGQTAAARGRTPFEPTTGSQIEAGIKYSPTWFNGFFTAAVYEITRQNVVTADPEYLYESVQYGEVETKGFEFSATAQVTESLRLIGQYSYTENEVTKGYPYAWESVDPVGKTPSGRPLHTAGLWADYTFLSGPLDGLGIGAGVRFVGSTYGDLSNKWKVPSYTLVDAALRYEFGDNSAIFRGLTLSINAQNIFDKEYINSCAAEFICTFGTGRRVTGSLTYRW